MTKRKAGLNTICTHVGEVRDTQFRGAVSPLYMSTSYAYENVDIKRYPRYFNTPNQEALCRKIAALEHTEAGLIFGSGMAAVSTSLLAFLNQGDHVVLSQQSYGGTHSLIKEEFGKYGIDYTFVEGTGVDDFEAAIRPETKVLHLETPSNPLLLVTDLEAVAKLAKSRGLVTLIDNTFASPVNQNPADFGIDVIIHSATKYMGGHSDICAGAVAASAEHINRIFQLAKNLGGSLSDQTVWMLERSLKTLGLRVRAQNENALQLARHLREHPDMAAVWYPGLEDHPGHAIARAQMHGFGGMMSFELADGIALDHFVNSLEWVKPSMSLAGVESTLTIPTLTSHALLSEADRERAGIRPNLIRFSTGIEEFEDLRADLDQAIEKAKRHSGVPTEN
ncbi:PLP-dependent aspartate aminotransferase family protein [Robiginitalea sp. SC105]|uniref:trans-sulfuration enzyme family protein n=1 Tax=Robiginitalea sp. SC105 TaxID=2762332 RepID=UPI00163B494F|nr:aminotransferase class I/II-fold pyridoxal phosphate-dependent enzyme [Robiginitalea sp. SC105]MBC2840396.1 aminotransferase class I/II-fold pyridoxal phosphate-dependent enzyme [Robiginitalea sp. SC105]